MRRIFHLAQEWGDVTTWLPRVRLNPGENSRLRVLTVQEEDAYLKAATDLAKLGRAQERDYEHALKGIRATLRPEQPIKPAPICSSI